MDSLNYLKDRYLDKSNRIYEDETYLVIEPCTGEFGGTVKFIKKATNTIYAAMAICPVTVNLLKNKYYVSSTLNHLSGFATVIEIPKPDSMQVYIPRKPKLAGEKKRKGEDESFSVKGTKQLVDTNGVTLLTSFVYKNNLYHIVSNDTITFLAKIAHNRFKLIDTICKMPIENEFRRVINYKKGHYISFVENEKYSGLIYIIKNSIRVFVKK